MLPSSLARLVRLLTLTLALGAFGSGCSSSAPPIRTGYVNFFIEFYDTVIDSTGKVQQAYCSNVVTFVGDVDFRCPFNPMVWSYGQNHWMYCTYRDSLGRPWWYSDLYYFWPGYIQEPACFDDYDYPEPPPEMSLTEDSVLNRDAAGQLILGDSVTLIDQGVALDTVVELRSLLAQNPALAGSDLLDARPSLLSSEPEEPIRLGTPEEGTPPE